MKNTTYTDEYLKFLEALNKYKVDYLLIGAYAVMIHTKTPRATKDMDTWIRQTEENAVKLIAALKEFTGKEVSREAIMKPNQRIELKSPTFKIEIWTSQEIVKFDDAWRKRKKEFVGRVAINIISKDDLIKLKKHFDRPQDRADLFLLESGTKTNNDKE